MASICITGKPGGGKSYEAVRMTLVEILSERFPKGSKLEGDFRNRTVITNVPFVREGVAAYMAKHHPEWFDQADLSKQLIVIPLADEPKTLPEFWRYRTGYEPTHPPITQDEYKAGARPDYTLNTGNGVVYILDEWHKFLNARQWGTTPLVILDYISQHRHFGDDVYWMTQSIANVDKQFKSVTAEYRFVRNMAAERFGFFRKGDGFRLEVYQSENFKVKPDTVRSYKFDKEIGASYKTSIIGGDADGGRKAKALPFKAFAFLGLAVLVSAILIISFGPEAFFGWFFGDDDEEQETSIPLPELAVVATEGKPALGLQRGAFSAPAVDRSETSVSFVTLKNLRPEAALLLAGTGSVQAVPEPSSGSLILRGQKKEVNELALVLAALDARADSSPVSIRAAIATVDLTDGEESALEVIAHLVESAVPVGIRLDDLRITTDPSLNISALAGGIDAVLNLAAGSGRFRVVSRPFLSTLNAVPVEFSAGREIPITTLTRDTIGSTTTTTFRPVELRIKMTAVRVEGGYRLTIVQSNSDVLGTETDDQGNQVPSLSSQTLDTTILVRDGEVAALGGMSVDTVADRAKGLPVLVRTPFLRRLGSVQRASQRRELLILVSVHGGNAAVPRNLAPAEIDPPFPSYSPAPALEVQAISGGGGGVSASVRPGGLPASELGSSVGTSARTGRRRGLLGRLFR